MFDSRPPSLSLAGGPSGVAGQLVRLQGDRVLEAVPDSADGDVMTMVGGVPDWATPASGTSDLSNVAEFKAKCVTRVALPNLSAVDLSDISQFDYVSLNPDDVVFVKEAADPDGNSSPTYAYNGLYIVGTPSGSIAPFTRAPWASTAAQLGGMKVYVAAGSSYSGTTWKLPLPGTSIGVNTTSLFFKRDDLGTYFQNLQTYKPIVMSVSTDSSVGEVFGGTVLSQSEHNFSGTTLKVYWEVTYYITSGSLTGEIRLVDKTNGSVIDLFSGLKSTDPVTLRSGNIVDALTSGRPFELELAIADGTTSADRIYVDSAFFIIRNTKD